MREWKNPTIVDLGLEETKGCTKNHGFGMTLDKKSSSSDSSDNGDSSCSSDCPAKGDS